MRQKPSTVDAMRQRKTAIKADGVIVKRIASKRSFRIESCTQEKCLEESLHLQMNDQDAKQGVAIAG